MRDESFRESVGRKSRHFEKAVHVALDVRHGGIRPFFDISDKTARKIGVFCSLFETVGYGCGVFGVRDGGDYRFVDGHPHVGDPREPLREPVRVLHGLFGGVCRICRRFFEDVSDICESASEKRAGVSAAETFHYAVYPFRLAQFLHAADRAREIPAFFFAGRIGAQRDLRIAGGLFEIFERVAGSGGIVCAVVVYPCEKLGGSRPVRPGAFKTAERLHGVGKIAGTVFFHAEIPYFPVGKLRAGSENRERRDHSGGGQKINGSFQHRDHPLFRRTGAEKPAPCNAQNSTSSVRAQSDIRVCLHAISSRR